MHPLTEYEFEFPVSRDKVMTGRAIVEPDASGRLAVTRLAIDTRGRDRLIVSRRSATFARVLGYLRQECWEDLALQCGVAPRDLAVA